MEKIVVAAVALQCTRVVTEAMTFILGCLKLLEKDSNALVLLHVIVFVWVCGLPCI
jgi:hypothetical protein